MPKRSEHGGYSASLTRTTLTLTSYVDGHLRGSLMRCWLEGAHHEDLVHLHVLKSGPAHPALASTTAHACQECDAG